MLKTFALSVAFAAAFAIPAFAADSAKINDAQIAHIAYTAGQIDIAAGKQALAKSKNPNIHKTVNAAVADTLIPNAQNAELKALLETGLKLFQEHQMHAEHMAAMTTAMTK